MNNHKTIRLSIALLLLFAMHIAIASISFTGISDEKMKGSKYSLMNINAFHHTLSISSLKYSLRYSGSGVSSQYPLSTGSSQMNSMMCYNRGNTTYIMPFKYKVSVPKFKTPTPNY